MNDCLSEENSTKGEETQRKARNYEVITGAANWLRR
jgi:hypothetical protein